jgi:hypothetical protein
MKSGNLGEHGRQMIKSDKSSNSDFPFVLCILYLLREVTAIEKIGLIKLEDSCLPLS